ncbi:alpha-2-macroglobulin [Fretibacter rubidus]|uniref:alpha-2-macroglobulin family protein n=1 Tax=Fretibacter rubidus TaxID=570162 RepID=UPI00352B304B
MKNPIKFVILGIAAFILAGWAGYHFYNPTASSSPVANMDIVATAPTQDARPQDITSELPAQTTPDSLRLLSAQINDNADSPTQCFNFNASFDSDQSVALRDFFTVIPTAPLTLTVAGDTLCLVGFSYTETYDVSWKSGLSAANGLSLNQDVMREVSFGDKPAFVGFAGEGVILPRINAQGLALETINVDALDVTIYRVSDRMLARRNLDAGKATLDGEWSWDGQDAGSDLRRQVWTGTLPVKSLRNQKVTTVLPMRELIGELEAGAYIVTAEREHEPNEDKVARAWRWIVSTDLALTSYRSDSGLSVSVRSIDSAALRPNVTLTLIAANNEILATTQSDRSGRASFDAAIMKGQGVLRPRTVMAYGTSGDYAVLELNRSPLDLSRYDVDGRTVSGPIDVFAYTERGVYRPGETVEFTALLRDEKGYAVADRPVSLEVTRPNGVIMETARIDQEALASQAGGLTYRYNVPSSAARGQWSIVINADGIGQISQTRFAVEDFVPQKLRLTLKTHESPMDADDIRDVTIDAQFLYGAPGAGLAAEAEARLRIDPNPFADFKDYSFGPAGSDFREQLLDMGGATTDGKGLVTLPLDIKNQNIKTSYPLRAEITAGVAEPGGRYTRDSLRLPVRTQSEYIGLKTDTGQARFAKGKPASLALVAVDRLGERINAEVTYSLIEEDWDYQWFRQGSRWRYRRDVIDTVINTGTLDIAADIPAQFSQRLDWGSYRLVVTSATGSESSYRFSVGWGSGEKSDAPDQIQMAGPSEPLNVGERFTLDINAPYAGQGELVIAGQDIHLIQTVELAAGGSQITLPFDKAWGEGVYAMLTLYTPRDVADRPVPRRAVGISYIALDRSDQTLNLSIDTPDLIRPRETHDFTVSVDNAPRGESVYMSFAAVDEGILQLTKYRSPEAAKTLFAKKALGLEIYDDYARLLNPNLGAPAMANSGGDGLGGEGLTAVPTRTVALFEGPVAVKNGKAVVSFDIPDFNGELRLMATAWSESAVGSASRPVTVRDKVPAIVGLPRFLAPGDTAQATISLDNVEGAAGTYTAALSTDIFVESGDAVTIDLPQAARGEDKITLTAKSLGVDNMTLNVSGPSGYSAVSDFPIQTRTPYRPVTRSDIIALAAGETLTLDQSRINGDFVRGSVDIDVSFSHVAGLDPKPYVNSLARYPYGCTEQTVATALPLLYTEVLGGFEQTRGQGTATHVRGLRKAINRLANRQDPQGVFGLWREGDGDARAWLGVHVTFFLQEAQTQGYAVPKDVLERSYNAVAEISRMPRYPNVNYRFQTDPYNSQSEDNVREKAEAAAYAHYVLTRAGRGSLPTMRYHFDRHSADMKTPVSHAYLGAALSMMGDNGRAQRSFEAGLAAKGYQSGRDYYQSPLRDNGGFIAAASEVDSQASLDAMLPAFLASLDKADRLNTQEKAYVILAMQALMQGVETPSISATGITLYESNTLVGAKLYDTDLDPNLVSGPTFTNESDMTVYATLSYSGAPISAPEPISAGIEASKTYLSMSGEPMDVRRLKQGDRAIVRIDFNSTARRSRMAVVADLLPAGVEIETVLRPKDAVVVRYGERTEGPYPFLGSLSDFDIMEARDDRFIASRQTYRTDDYRAAYIIRAVTPGDFVNPGVVVEDMYRPQDSAVTEASRMRITGPGTL